MEFLRQLWNGTVQAWRRLSLSARINLGLAVLATVVVIAFVVIRAGTPTFARLYDGLDPAEAQQIVEIIQQQGVTPEVQDGGRTILVPASRLSDMKLAVAGEGLPSRYGTTPGFELFDRESFATNRMLHDVHYMRAIQGELQRQLEQFDFVSKAFVFIRESKDELFISEQRPSEAAVTLDVRRPLSRKEIDGVLHVIASFGGPNLSLNNITLMTTSGDTLYLPPSNDFESIANSKLSFVAELEKQREDRVMRDLEAMGVRGIVKVSATVNFDSQTETRSESKDGALLSAQSITSQTTSEQGLPEGPAGATQNLPEGAVRPAGEKTSETMEETTENFEPTLIKTETVKSPGQVEKYLVSAIIEGSSQPAVDEQGNPLVGDDGKPRVEYVGLTDDQKAMYEKHIAAAVGEGVTPTEVSIHDHPFDISQLAAAQSTFQAIESAKLRDNLLGWASSFAKIALIVVLFWWVRRILRKAIITPREEEEGGTLAHPEASPEDLRREEVFEEVARISQDNPEAVASLIRAWIAQDDE